MHHHKCDHCGSKVPCDGTWERNYDGWPEVICDRYHRAEDESVRICESCQRVRQEDWQAEQETTA